MQITSLAGSGFNPTLTGSLHDDETSAPSELVGSHVGNLLLAALGPADLAALEPHLTTVRLGPRTALFGPGGSITHVYFPETAVVSLVNSLSDGRMVETATVGRDGMAGLPAFLQAGAPSPQAFVHVPGVARRMDATVFRQLSGVAGPLHDVMLAYTLTFLTQVAQTAACNGSHLLEERCARWLLMTAERAGVSTFPLTHDFLSFMLGVRRAGVTNAMRSLQDQHLIRYVRGRMEILDDVGLERASCECYGTMKVRAPLSSDLV